MDWSYVQEIIPRFVQAALVTLRLSAWGVSLSLLLGLAVALVTSYRVRPFDSLARAYIELSRNTPLLIQLFFLYYGLPKIGIHWDGFTCGVIALTFLGGSYMAEALRTSLQAVPRGQVESARAIGLRRAQILRHVGLPQALAIIKPALFGQYMNIAKNTSLGMAVGLAELSYRSRQAEAETFMSFQVYGIGTVLYIVLVFVIGLLGRKMSRRRQRSAWQQA